jgi:hypothetical protein
MNEVVPSQAFEEKIKDRLRRDIGDLIPDEVLAQLIQRSINSIFFEPRVKKSEYGHTLESKPSWFQETVEGLLRKEVDRLLHDYLENNREALKAEFTKILETKGPELVAGFFIGVLLNQQSAMAWTIQQILQNRSQ